MKPRYLLSVAIIPFIIAYTSNFYQGKSQDKNKGKQERSYSPDKSNDDKEKGGQKNHSNHSNNKHNDYSDNNFKNDNKSYKGKPDKGKNWKVDDKWDDGKWDDNRFSQRMGKIKNIKKSKWVNERYYPGIVWWEANNYYDVKSPRNSKKVTLCHKPNGSDYPVAINVSVNALKAHLNHGDYEGECRDYDRSIYSDTYWNTRTEYYNQYVQTTETLSLGEQLLNLAIQKLTNSSTQLATLRPGLSQQEIIRREQAIINLQNDTYALQNSLAVGNTRVATVNFVL